MTMRILSTMSMLVLWRRMIFTLALLLTGALTIACIQTIYLQRPSLEPLGNVLWGFDSLGLILAFWVAGRFRSWRSWSDWTRLITYFLAYGYGGMLFDATQDWWTGTAPEFQLPGLTYEAYGRPLLTILPVLSTVLLFSPLFRTFRYTLDERDNPSSTLPISIFDLLSWTALAAIVFVWIRFLNSDLAPRTGYSSSSLTQNFKDQTSYLLLSLIPAAVLLAQLIAWRRHWIFAVVVLIVGWVFDSLVTGFATQVIGTFTGMSFGILSVDSLDRWCYIGGRSLLGFCFGGLALFFGMTFQRTAKETTTSKSEA